MSRIPPARRVEALERRLADTRGEALNADSLNAWVTRMDAAGVFVEAYAAQEAGPAALVAAKWVAASGSTTNRQFQLLTNHGVSSCE